MKAHSKSEGIAALNLSTTSEVTLWFKYTSELIVSLWEVLETVFQICCRMRRVFSFSKQNQQYDGLQVKQPSSRHFFSSIMFVSMYLLSLLFH
jgi:hypothetical protein